MPPRQLPTLQLLRDGTVGLGFRPHGLWIIGANGWIDVVKGEELYRILDRAMTFEVPRWHIFSEYSRRDIKPFDAAQFAALLAP